MKKLSDYVDCNPTVKLKKGNHYTLVDIDSIEIGRKYSGDKGTVEYTGQGSSKFSDGDTIMARITPCLENGKIAQYRGATDAIGSTEFFVFRAKKGISSADFVYYFMKQAHVRNYAANSMTGASGRQRADIGFIKKLKCNFPQIEKQERIVSILSAYDDLIENNNKRIKILEKMAENLYKEWFVRFRFPGHEQAEFENGMPKGWERVKLSDIIDFNPTIRKTHQTEYKIIPMAALSNTNLLIDDSLFELSEKPEGSRSCNGDTLLARITPCLENGKTGFVHGLKPGEVAGGSTEFIVMRAKAISRYLVYFIARDPLFRGYAIASMNGADGRQRVKVAKLERTQWIRPDSLINAAFEEKCEPIFGLIYKLCSENRNLTKQRNLLLPRLMSGKLEV